MLEIKELAYSYKDKQVLKNINLEIAKGELVAVLGKNGAGKSTLFKCILGILNGYEGEINIDKRNIKSITHRELAALISYMPQNHNRNINLSVLDMVLMGLSHTLPLFSLPKCKQELAAMAALERVGIKELALKSYYNISGGEKQLAVIARSIIQNSKVWILDEPCSNLDFGNQLRVLKELKSLAEEGYLIILSSHNPEQCFLYADKLIVLHENTIKAVGKPDILTSELISEVYDWDIKFVSMYNDKLRFAVPGDLLE